MIGPLGSALSSVSTSSKWAKSSQRKVPRPPNVRLSRVLILDAKRVGVHRLEQRPPFGVGQDELLAVGKEPVHGPGWTLQRSLLADALQ